MPEFLKTLFDEKSFDSLFVIAGLAFLGVAVVGNITGKISPGKGGRIASGVLGPILIIVGLLIHGGHVHGITGSRMSEMKWNQDLFGADYSGFPLPTDNPKQCEDACKSASKCRAWTFVKPNTTRGPNPMCYLKEAIPPPREDTCCVSGTKQE